MNNSDHVSTCFADRPTGVHLLFPNLDRSLYWFLKLLPSMKPVTVPPSTKIKAKRIRFLPPCPLPLPLRWLHPHHDIRATALLLLLLQCLKLLLLLIVCTAAAFLLSRL